MSKAQRIINASIDRMAHSDEPDAYRPRIAGEIDMAYKLGLMTYPERDHAMGNMVAACARRREQLRKAKLERLGITE